MRHHGWNRRNERALYDCFEYDTWDWLPTDMFATGMTPATQGGGDSAESDEVSMMEQLVLEGMSREL